MFEEVCAREYSEPAFGAVHLLTVDTYALQHSEEHGPRSNAFHLLRLRHLLELGASPALGKRPDRAAGKALERRYRGFPQLGAPRDRGALTVAGVYAARDATEHEQRVLAWARCVWEAYRAHHEWARATDAAVSAHRVESAAPHGRRKQSDGRASRRRER